MNLIEKAICSLLGVNQIEKKLLRCQSYRPGSISKWKSQLNINWLDTANVLKAIDIYDAGRIKKIIHDIVVSNQELFNRPNLYITAFGSQGKSGGQIAYQFKHTQLNAQLNFVDGWALSKLPQDSTVVFVDDLIGTGTQSTEFIVDKLNLLINPSSDPYLLTICATPEGIAKVESETNFNVITGIILTENEHQYYSENNNYFSAKLKGRLKEINGKLKKSRRFDYDKGLLVTFFYSPPNNSMPMLWKDKFLYNDNGEEKMWFALIPRQ